MTVSAIRRSQRSRTVTSGVATLRVPLPLTSSDFEKLRANIASVLLTMKDGLVSDPPKDSEEET